jgi:hypothetical protein
LEGSVLWKTFDTIIKKGDGEIRVKCYKLTCGLELEGSWIFGQFQKLTVLYLVLMASGF